jgi:ribosome-binding factor A
LIEKKRLKVSNSMSSTRVPKVEDFLRKEISQIISSKVRDPRYKFLNIVDVKCSTDLSVATVFYTIIDGDISDSPDLKSLEKFASMVRSKLSKFMEIRRVPKLIFKYDESLERYNNIDALLNSLSD